MATLMQNVIVCRTTILQTNTSQYGGGKKMLEFGTGKQISEKREKNKNSEDI
jgi:hypothetical protein